MEAGTQIALKFLNILVFKWKVCWQKWLLLFNYWVGTEYKTDWKSQFADAIWFNLNCTNIQW